MGNTILRINTTGITSKGTNAATETTLGNNVTTENNGLPGNNSILGNKATTENNDTSVYNTVAYSITSGNQLILESNATIENNEVTGNNATTENQIPGINRFMGNSVITGIHTVLGNKTLGTHRVKQNTTIAVLGNKASESGASMGSNATISQIKNVWGNIAPDSQAQENSDILGNNSTENQAMGNSDILENNPTTGNQVLQKDTLGNNAIPLENVFVGNDTLELVPLGNLGSLGINTHLGNNPLETAAPTGNKTLENIIPENYSTVENNSITGSTLWNKLTKENLDMLENKISENITLGIVSTESYVSLGNNEDILGISATTGIQLLGTNVTMENRGNKILGNNIKPLEEDTLCWGPGINDTALCGGEPSSEENTESISLRDFICNKRAQGSPPNREELHVRLGRAQCKDPGMIETLTLIFSYINLTELQGTLGQLNDSACHPVTMKALWTVLLQGKLDFQDTPSLRWWFHGLLQPFLVLLSREDLQCLPHSTLGCEQYQAM